MPAYDYGYNHMGDTLDELRQHCRHWKIPFTRRQHKFDLTHNLEATLVGMWVDDGEMPIRPCADRLTVTQLRQLLIYHGVEYRPKDQKPELRERYIHHVLDAENDNLSSSEDEEENDDGDENNEGDEQASSSKKAPKVKTRTVLKHERSSPKTSHKKSPGSSGKDAQRVPDFSRNGTKQAVPKRESAIPTPNLETLTREMVVEVIHNVTANVCSDVREGQDLETLAQELREMASWIVRAHREGRVE